MCKEKLVLDLSQFLRTPFSSITAFSSTVLETHDELASESLTTTMRISFGITDHYHAPNLTGKKGTRTELPTLLIERIIARPGLSGSTSMKLDALKTKINLISGMVYCFS